MKPILTIDDSKNFQLILSQILSAKGFTTQSAFNGIEGLRLMASHFPPLVTLDLEMPMLNGYSMMKIMSFLGIQVPTILVTGDSDSKHRFESFKNLVALCPKEKIAQLLPGLVEQALSAQSRREYLDLEYKLDQRELYALLSPREKKRVLLVDDSPTLLRVLASELERTGLYQIFSAAEGREGLFKAVMLQPELILSDVEMPVLDGPTMAQILYVLGHPFPILFVSSQQDQQVVQRARSLKAVLGYLDKQEVMKNPKLLHQEVERFLGISAQDRAATRAVYRQVDLDRLVSSVHGGGLLELG